MAKRKPPIVTSKVTKVLIHQKNNKDKLIPSPDTQTGFIRPFSYVIDQQAVQTPQTISRIKRYRRKRFWPKGHNRRLKKHQVGQRRNGDQVEYEDEQIVVEDKVDHEDDNGGNDESESEFDDEKPSIHFHLDSLIDHNVLSYLVEELPWDDLLSRNSLNRVVEEKFVTEHLVEEGGEDEDTNHRGWGKEVEHGNEWTLVDDKHRSFLKQQAAQSQAAHGENLERSDQTGEKAQFQVQTFQPKYPQTHPQVQANPPPNPQPRPQPRPQSRPEPLPKPQASVSSTHVIRYRECPIHFKEHFARYVPRGEVRTSLSHYMECQRENRLGAEPFGNLFHSSWTTSSDNFGSRSGPEPVLSKTGSTV